MLNISNNPIHRDEILKDQSAYQQVMYNKASRKIIYLLTGLFLLGFTILFLPWTQNIRSGGELTTLSPEDREQNIHTIISGRIEKWYVNEGELVKQGDTVVFISEMKAEYLDPQLVDRAKKQTDAKKESVGAYQEKTRALTQQITALEKNRELKMEQAQNYLAQARLKVTSDSIDFQTAKLNKEISVRQFESQEKLYKQGLKSLTELEERRQKLQGAENKKIAAENKWLISKNELVNAKINLNTITNEFQGKIAKARSDQMAALSGGLEAEGEFNKLSIQEANYLRRSGFYYITAPQDGFVTRAMVTGIGETVKEGQALFSFIPANYELAVALYVRPIDLPLISEGNKVRLQFDGWPAMVFSGWPDLSFGTYSGEIVAFDKAAGQDGKFRILVAPDPNAVPWPNLLRLGSGVYGIALLKNVPVWYELWRNLNGFPPDFYHKNNENLKTEMKN